MNGTQIERRRIAETYIRGRKNKTKGDIGGSLTLKPAVVGVWAKHHYHPDGTGDFSLGNRFETRRNLNW